MISSTFLHSSPLVRRFAWGMLTVLLGGAMARVQAEGTVTNNTTTALLRAMAGGGSVRLNLPDVLTLETPVIVAADTVLESAATAGRSATVSGGGLYRLFQVLPGIRFELRDVVLRDGLAESGGAILNEGTLVASNVVFTSCEAAGTRGVDGADGAVGFGFGDPGGHGTVGTPAYGGAVHNLGVARFQSCTFTVNTASGGDGGAGGAGGAGISRTGRGGDGAPGSGAFGGAISSSGPLELLRCVFSGNAARGGAGGAGGSTGTTVGAGQGASGAAAAGGAVHSTGWLLLSSSSFTTNLVAGGAAADAGAPEFNLGRDGAGGGAAWGGAVASWSTGIVVNTTFYTNLMAGGSGGDGAAGTFTVGDGGAGGDAFGSAIHARGSLSVTNVTFAWNTGVGGTGGAAGQGGRAGEGPAGRLGGSAIAADSGARVTAVNTIFAATGLSTVRGPVVDSGSNLFTDAGTGGKAPGSIYGTHPLLGAYQVWSVGPPGCLPLPGSPAVDRAALDSLPALDQRGLPRPSGAGPDIGALEVGNQTYFIGGVVLDGDSGMPGVRMKVGTNTVVTDGGGRFRAGPLIPGFYNVTAVEGAAEYTPQVLQVPLVDADVTDLVFRLRRLVVSLVHGATAGTDLLTASGVPGASYHLEGSTDLRDWTFLDTVSADSSGHVVFLHSPGPVPSWFYRLARAGAVAPGLP